MWTVVRHDVVPRTDAALSTYSVSNDADAMGTNSFMGLSVNGKKKSKDR